jgi:4-amino-4-deoxy-L-arabinose transferase-like glycosyltransferase
MTGSLLEDRRTAWLVLSLTILLFAVGNLPWQLDDYDQAKQAFTSFEMIKEGHWFYQHTPRERVATKPPLVGWISACLFAATRSWEIAWRLPSFLAAIALAMLLFRAASSAYGTIAGLVAFSAFGLNLLSPRLATLVRTDMPLAFVIFLVGLLVWKKIRGQEEWKTGDRVYIFALLAIAMLIKGPILYAFLLPGIALFQWRAFKERRLGQPSISKLTAGKPSFLEQDWSSRTAWSGWWPWIASMAVFLLWVTGGILFQPGFFNEVVMREFLGRFGETIHRPQPLYFYLPHLVHKFAPWSVLIIAIAMVDLRTQNWRLRSVFREMSPETFWLVCWSLGGLIAMSLIPSKRVDRIFPVIPPLCLLLAAQVGSRISCRRGSRSRSLTNTDSHSTGHTPSSDSGEAGRPVATAEWTTRVYRWILAALIFAVLVTASYTTWKVVTGYRDNRDALAIFGRDVRYEAEANRWRYEVVSAKDEGLLLYLQKAHYIEPDRAVAEWNSGNLDALVVSTGKAPGLMTRLRGATVSQLKSTVKRKEQGTDYVLIVR